jgi:hypothetical protein
VIWYASQAPYLEKTHMKIAHSDFLRLIDAVEEDGGKHLDESCTGTLVEFKEKDGKVVRDLTMGCNQDTLFEVPYDPSEMAAVPEPIMEPDDNRSPYIGLDGEERQPRRSRKDDNDNPLVEIVMRKGRDSGGIPSSVKVCALDDNVGMWPRYAHTMQDPRSK